MGRDAAPAPQTRRGYLEALHALGEGRVQSLAGRAGLQHGEARRGGADRSRDVELVARPPAAARQDAAPAGAADGGDV